MTEQFSYRDVGDDDPPKITSTSPEITFGQVFVVSGNSFGGDAEGSGGTNGILGGELPAGSDPFGGKRPGGVARPGPDCRTFPDDPMTLTVSHFPTLDVGWHSLTVVRAGSESEPVLVPVTCSLWVGELSDVEVAVGDRAIFSVEAEGARRFQWQRDLRGDGHWIELPGETGPTYTTDPVGASDSGSRYAVVVYGNCESQISNVAVLRVTDTASPLVEVESPSGGEYWLLSEPGSPANEEVVSWSMSDDIRVCSVAVSLEHCDPGAGSCDMAAGSWAGAAADCGLADGCAETFGPGGTCGHPGESTTSAVFTVPGGPPVRDTGLAVPDQGRQRPTTQTTPPRRGATTPSTSCSQTPSRCGA